MLTIVDFEKFKLRFFCLLSSCPEVFLSGFLWQAFGLACGCENTATSYFFMTGFGGALGAGIGHICSRLTIEDGSLVLPKRARNRALATFAAMFLGSATSWQKVVNDTNDYGMNFTQAFFFIFSTSFVLFLTTLAVLRAVGYVLKFHFIGAEKYGESVQMRFYYDAQIAMSVAMADAFFLGIITSQLVQNLVLKDCWIDRPPSQVLELKEPLVVESTKV
jgi:hypothetical protein